MKDDPQLNDLKGPGTEKMGHFYTCAFMQIFANLEFIPINSIVLKVPPIQIWSRWFLEVAWAISGLAYSKQKWLTHLAAIF